MIGNYQFTDRRSFKYFLAGTSRNNFKNSLSLYGFLSTNSLISVLYLCRTLNYKISIIIRWVYKSNYNNSMLLNYTAKNPFSVNELCLIFDLVQFCVTLRHLDDLNHSTSFQNALYYSTESRLYSRCVKLPQLCISKL